MISPSFHIYDIWPPHLYWGEYKRGRAHVLWTIWYIHVVGDMKQKLSPCPGNDEDIIIVLWRVYQFLSVLLVFYERKIKNIFSWLY